MTDDPRIALLSPRQRRALTLLTPGQRERRICSYLRERSIRIQVEAGREAGLALGDAVRGDPIAKGRWGI